MSPAARAAVAVAATGILSAAYQRAADAADRRRFPPPGRLVDVSSRRIHVLAKGEGTPAVVIVPALASNVLEWVRVQRAAATKTTVCVCDRAGVGFPVKSTCRSSGHYFSRQTRMPVGGVYRGE